MTLYGEDNRPDQNVATQTARVDALSPAPKSYSTQWTYDDDTFVQHFGSGDQSTSLLVKFQKP